MLNEAIYRTPKWLRNFVDFEVSTGQDIKGEPSKKQIEKDRKEKEEQERQRILNEWDKRWASQFKDYNNKEQFKQFFEDRFPDEFRKKYSSYLYTSDLENIKNTYRGNMWLWQEFDRWIAEKEEKEEKQRKISEELNTLYDSIISDFANNQYSDKFSSYQKEGKKAIKYKFEDGKIFEIWGDAKSYKISWEGYTYTLGFIYSNKFIALINYMINNSGKRPASKQKTYSGSSSYGSSSGKKETTGDPIKDKYNKLKATIKLREEQLKRMSKTDSERTTLENELETSKSLLNRMKTKYQFEHLNNFYNFKE